MGNPYASAIDSDMLINNNAAIDALYFWEHILPPSTDYPGPRAANFDMGDISVYTLGGGVPAANGGATPTKWMPSGQGFGIKALDATPVVFTNDMRVTGPNTGYRNNNTTPIDRLRLRVSNDNEELNSTMLLAFTENATLAYDTNYEARRLATPVSLYSVMKTDDQLAIQGLPAFNEDYRIQVGISSLIKVETALKISIYDIEGELISNAPVYLIDHKTGITTNLLFSDYRFSVKSGQFTDRFTLVFKRDGINTYNRDKSGSVDTIEVYPNPTVGELTIASPFDKITQIEIYDLRGRLMSSDTIDNQNQVIMNIDSLDTALYFIKIITPTQTIMKRVLKE